MKLFSNFFKNLKDLTVKRKQTRLIPEKGRWSSIVLSLIADHVRQNDLKLDVQLTVPFLPSMPGFVEPSPIQLMRWTKIAVLARYRSDTCASLLCQSLMEDGHLRKDVETFLGKLAPSATVGNSSDNAYVESELDYMDYPCFDSALALAHAILRYDQELAIKVAAKAEAYDPSRHRAAEFLGKFYSSVKKHDLAIFWLLKALEAGATGIHLILSQQSNLASKFHEALDVIADCPFTTSELTLEKTRALREIEGNAYVISQFEKLYKDKKLDDSTCAEFAECLFSERQYSDAIRVGKFAADAGLSKAVRVVGISYLLLEDWENAEIYLERYVINNIGDKEVFSFLAESYIRLKKYAPAEPTARAALHIGPCVRSERSLAISLIMQGKTVDALEHFQNYKSSYVPQEYRALICDQTNQLQVGEDVSRTWAESQATDRFEGWHWLGYFLERQGRDKEALEAYENGSRLNPEHKGLISKIEKIKDKMEDASFSNRNSMEFWC